MVRFGFLQKAKSDIGLTVVRATLGSACQLWQHYTRVAANTLIWLNFKLVTGTLCGTILWLSVNQNR